MHSDHHAIVIGAGAGGLAAAISLACQGLAVTVLERAATPGGKMRRVNAGGQVIDAGPTVLTMRWVFERLFENAGISLSSRVTLSPAALLARHAWGPEERLDLFADIDRSADAIAAFAGPREADGYRRFVADSAAMFATLRPSYIDAERPGPLTLMRRIGLSNLPAQLALKPWATMHGAISGYFRDPRLVQLFARYATYCGSNPWLAPATLMLVAHVEQDGVWVAKGGMHGLARAMERLARDLGVLFRYGADVEAIECGRDGVTGVRLAGGERLQADRVVFNGDISAVARLTSESDDAGIRPVPATKRSLSALTFAVSARTDGFPLAHHTVFFSRDYAREFLALTRQRSMPDEPTVYICAQDRDDAGTLDKAGSAERLLFILNAPADGDTSPLTAKETSQCLDQSLSLIARAGLSLNRADMAVTPTTPQDFAQLFPGTGGALYGRASHGWTAAFRRPGARTRIPGLYLAGGSAHPGPGMPMAALSGMLAAESLIADLASTHLSRPAVISGGMSTA